MPSRQPSNELSETSLVRHLKLLLILRARRQGASVKELATETGVSEKTIRRDLIAFASVGFLVKEIKQERGRKVWMMDSQHAIPQVGFTFEEAFALCMGRHLLGPLSGTFVGAAARTGIDKIRAFLGRDVVRYIDRMAPQLYATAVGLADYSRKSELIDRLLIGMEDRKVVFITYQSQRSTEPTTYDCHPYGLTVHKGSLYLVGFAPQHNEIRHWKVSRIEAADVDVMPFNMPAEFRLDKHFAGSFGVFQGKDDVRVRIRFSSVVARYVTEANWHASQKLTPQTDGGLIAEFRLSSTAEIKQWALSFGGHAEVLEPPILRTELAADVEQMIAMYRVKSPRVAKST